MVVLHEPRDILDQNLTYSHCNFDGMPPPRRTMYEQSLWNLCTDDSTHLQIHFSLPASKETLSWEVVLRCAALLLLTLTTSELGRLWEVPPTVTYATQLRRQRMRKILG